MGQARSNDKAARREQQRALQQQAEEARVQARRRQRVTRVILATVGVVAVAIAALYVVRASTGGTSTAVAANLGPPTAALPGSPTGQFQLHEPVLRQHGKVEVLFIGALYCPYCAAERWSIVKALDQFGSFSGLKSTTNTQGEGGFGVIPTFELLGAGYQSKYVSLDAKDTQDRNHQPLQTLNNSETSNFNRLDPGGGIPLVAVGGYAQSGSGYQPSEIDGMSFAAVQHALQTNSTAGFAGSINAEANVLTALICHADGNQPSRACGVSAVRQIERSIR